MLILSVKTKMDKFETKDNKIIDIMKDYSHPSHRVHLEVLKLIPECSKVLSAGCGSGREVKYLSEVKNCNVVGIDIDPQVICRGMTPRAECYVKDMATFISEEKFDYIVCLWNTINYPEKEDRTKFIKNCEYNLKDGGILLMTTKHKYFDTRTFLSHLKTKYFKKHVNPNYYFPYSEISEWFKDTSFDFNINRFENTLFIKAKSHTFKLKGDTEKG